MKGLNEAKDNIAVSKFSCTHPTQGKSVAAHELGHAISYAFYEKKLSPESYEEFKKLRACADSHHKQKITKAPNPILHHPGDSLRTEEDTADLIAYRTFPDTANIFECALLETSGDGSFYKDLSLENKETRDTHSSSLFRVIMEFVHKKKKVPESCLAVMKEDPKFGYEPCF